MNIEHIAIWSEDIETLRSFYEKYFNAVSNDQYKNSAKGFSSYFLSFESGARLEIMQMDSIPKSSVEPYKQSIGLIHLAFHLLIEKLNVHLTLLIAWGKNPLILYLIHYWIWIYAFIAPLARTWHFHAPLWLIILQASGFVGLLSLVAWIMDRRRWIVSM